MTWPRAGSLLPIAVASTLTLLMLAAGCAASTVPDVEQIPVDESVLHPSDEGAALEDEDSNPPAQAIEAKPEPEEERLSADPEDDASAATESETVAPAIESKRVDLVYFHTEYACGCLAEIGDVIETALHTYFPDEMAQKTVRFYPVVSDDPKNEQLVRVYGSQPFDLFIVTYEEGRVEATPVHGIWAFMDDYEALAASVKQLVQQNLS